MVKVTQKFLKCTYFGKITQSWMILLTQKKLMMASMHKQAPCAKSKLILVVETIITVKFKHISVTTLCTLQIILVSSRFDLELSSQSSIILRVLQATQTGFQSCIRSMLVAIDAIIIIDTTAQSIHACTQCHKTRIIAQLYYPVATLLSLP